MFLSWARDRDNRDVIHVQDITDGNPPIARLTVRQSEFLAACGRRLGTEPAPATTYDGQKCRAGMRHARALGMRHVEPEFE